MADSRHLHALLEEWKQAVAGTSLPQPPAYGGPDVQLRQLVEHTDRVEPGSAFVARVRTTSDGHRYIPVALEKGASLIIGQHDPASLPFSVPETVAYLRVEDTALAYAWLAAAWEGFPTRELVVIGVTGTDGKTTTCNLLHEILKTAGYRAGLLSTIRAIIGDREEPLALHVTTPEAPVVQHYLRQMVDAGLTHCVLEATSHGLAQHRVGAIDFDVAVVTNITHEHLDYHGSYEEYFAAKARLFRKVAMPAWPHSEQRASQHAPIKTAVLNRDDSSYAALSTIGALRQLTYGIDNEADGQARAIQFRPTSTRFTLQLPGASLPINSGLVGDFNVYNMLAAATAAYALAVSPTAIQQGLEAVDYLSGRMERIDEGQPFLTVVDFAHTPNSLERAIESGRHLLGDEGRIIAVFGSAGLRDVEKRRMMAETSARAADLTVLTAEDPRTESLDEILEMMAEGCRRQGGIEGETFWRIRDRGRAIYQAMRLARPEDLVLICGKGHEQSMCFGRTEYPWDDREATRTALRTWLQEEPMPDLGLPTYEPEEE